MKSILLTFLLVLVPGSAFAAEFELKDGDRVVWLGSTLIEREQRYGYWEFLLTAHYPERNITFRNLGWSGDNVYGEARLRFDITQPQLGLQRMVELTFAEKPTVIFIAYGTNESFEGKEGLPKFEKGLEKLLDALAPTKARIVLFSPLPEEAKFLSPDAVKARNQSLAVYRDAIKTLAGKRNVAFADLFAFLGEGTKPLPEGSSENGMHLTGLGYANSAEAIGKALGWSEISWEVAVDGKALAKRAKFTWIKEPTEFEVLPESLSLPIDVLSPSTSSTLPQMSFKGLASGQYALKIGTNDRQIVTAEQLQKGVALTKTDFVQAEQLRQAIIAKNQLYFYRWRPQNETYLFGFRKHEQGRNAKEIVEFDPLIAEKEKEIARLRKPTALRCQLTTQPKP